MREPQPGANVLDWRSHGWGRSRLRPRRFGMAPVARVGRGEASDAIAALRFRARKVRR
jgi:hypothetical protein